MSEKSWFNDLFIQEAKAALDSRQSAGGGGVSADWNQNDPTAPDYVKGRTHWAEGAITLQWDGNAEGREVGTFKDNIEYTLCKVSDKVYTVDDFVARDDYGLKLTVIGSEQDEAIPETDLYIVDIGKFFGAPAVLVAVSGINSSYNPCLISVGASINLEDGLIMSFPSAGTYLADMSSADVEYWDNGDGSYGSIGYIKSVTSEGTVHKLDEKYLPESVEGVVIRSSTADSTKKFKLTVDDSGTITATEVTDS